MGGVESKLYDVDPWPTRTGLAVPLNTRLDEGEPKDVAVTTVDRS
jgi:hypothetical protein